MIVAIDYETMDDRGASFEYFRKDFRVFSLSCAFRDPGNGEIITWFSNNPTKIVAKLADLARAKHQIVAHNLPYEYGVTRACYPHIHLNWHADTMRLAQVRDGGGDEFNPPELSMEQSIALELGEMSEKEASALQRKGVGLSLEACAQRFLSDPGLHNHKKPAHDWLQEHKGIKKNFGRELHHLPYELLEQYNNADTRVTLLLYEECIKWAKLANYDWQKDHTLYLMRGRLITDAYARGILIDKDALFQYILEVEAEIKAIEAQFVAFMAPYSQFVMDIRRAVVDLWANDPKLKSDRARANRRAKVLEGKEDKRWKVFNTGSSKQLQLLFVDVLKIKPQFLTKKESPSFKTTHLHQWGEGGLILQKRRKRLLVLQQCVNTYVAALYDDRVHCSVRVSGTRTNRTSGGQM